MPAVAFQLDGNFQVEVDPLLYDVIRIEIDKMMQCALWQFSSELLYLQWQMSALQELQESMGTQMKASMKHEKDHSEFIPALKAEFANTAERLNTGWLDTEGPEIGPPSEDAPASRVGLDMTRATSEYGSDSNTPDDPDEQEGEWPTSSQPEPHEDKYLAIANYTLV